MSEKDDKELTVLEFVKFFSVSIVTIVCVAPATYIVIAPPLFKFFEWWTAQWGYVALSLTRFI